jgi:23S rRNA-/tRNA-specific pseudouridylate synthase
MNKEIKIIKDGEDYQVIYKPVFMLSEDVSSFICHRLDFETSGLLLAAKNEKALEFYQRQFKKREIKKKYWALVLGQFPEKEQIVEGFLARDKNKPFRFESAVAIKSEGNLDHRSFQIFGKKARWSKTKFHILQTKKIKIFKEKKYQDYNYISLVEATPLTGRRHQLRIHLNHLGYPILGDKTYNTKLSRKAAKNLQIPHLQLFAVYLSFIDSAENQIEVENKPDLEIINKD